MSIYPCPRCMAVLENPIESDWQCPFCDACLLEDEKIKRPKKSEFLGDKWEKELEKNSTIWRRLADE